MPITKGTWSNNPLDVLNYDFGATEFINNLLQGKLSGTSLVNPNRYAPSIGPQSTDTRLQPGTTVNPQGQVLSAYTDNVTPTSTTTSGGSGGTNSIDLGTQLAESETDRRIRMIRELFGQGQQQVADYRNNINNRFNDILKAVGAFRDRSLTLKNDAAQEITNNAASTLGSNAKTAQQLAGSANAQGRNLGLSSKVNLGQRLLGNLQSTQGNVLARKGEQNAANNSLYQERQDQAQAQENDATTARDQGLATADQYDRQNLANYGSNLEGAQVNFATLLNNVLGKQEALNAINPLNSNGLTGYTPNFNGIVNTINGVLSSIPGQGSGTVSPDAGNLANPQTYADYLKRFKGLYTG